MKMAVVECLLRVTQNGNISLLSIPKAGPDALLVSEIPILRAINDIEEGGDEDCCVSQVALTDVVEVSKAGEIDRLKMKYGRQVVDHIYPGGRGLPETVEDCEIPVSALALKKAKKTEAA